MSWEHSDGRVTFDFNRSFDEQLDRLKSKKGGKFRRGSQNYFVLRALFYGHTIDDYKQRPLDNLGHPINNVRTRVAQLKNEWGVAICSRTSPHGKYKEYKIGGRDE